MTTPQTPVDALTDDECDAIVARVMDEVAKAKGLEHAMHLNADITTQHTLRRAIVRASARALAAIPEGFVLVPVEIVDRFPEINPSNYDHDDACALNSWGVELVLAAAPTPPTAPAQDAQGVDGDEINSPFNACMFRDKCRSMLAALRASSPADRIEADEALMRTSAEALEHIQSWFTEEQSGYADCAAAITALRKRLESSK